MSLKTWKAEFYPKEPTKRMSTLDAVKHSLTKWKGLTSSNLKKHDLTLTRHSDLVEDIDGEDTTYFDVDSKTCALCVKFLDNPENILFSDDTSCLKCPLYKSLGNKECGDGRLEAPYTAWKERRNPKPMIKALEKLLKELGG